MTFHVFNVLRQTITENEDLVISLDKAIISLDEDARFDLTLKKSVVKNFPPLIYPLATLCWLLIEQYFIQKKFLKPLDNIFHMVT